MQELFGILGRNYRGLQRLFNTEWRTAVEVSNNDSKQKSACKLSQKIQKNNSKNVELYYY